MTAEQGLRQLFFGARYRCSTEKLATLGVGPGMTVDDESYRAAIVETVAACIRAREG